MISFDQSNAGAMGDGTQITQMSISAMLDLFPQPPTTIPQPTTPKPAATKAKSERKKFGTLLRSGWAGSIGGSGQDVRKTSFSNTSDKPAPASERNLSTLAKKSSPETFASTSDFDDRLKYKLAAGIPDKDYIDLLKRACKGVIAPKEQELLFKFLLSLPPTAMADFQKAVQEMTFEKPTHTGRGRASLASLTGTLSGKGGGIILLDISTYYIDFGLKTRKVKMHETVYDSFFIAVKAGKVKYTVISPENQSGYEMTIEPSSGKLKNKDQEEIKITIRVTRPVTVSDILAVEVENSFRHFVAIHLSSEWSHFGSELSELEVDSDEVISGSGRVYKVPKVLKKLRELLDAKNGLEMEEVFRKQVDEESLLLYREQFDQGTHLDALTPTVISTLIKIWFRELPEKIFDVSIPEVIVCDSKEKSLKLYKNRVPDRFKDLACWLFDLMTRVIENKDKNRMTTKKLSIVFAPNAFPQNVGSTNADYLRRQADVFFHVLEHHIQEVKQQ